MKKKRVRGEVSNPLRDAVHAVQATLAQQCAALRLVSPTDRVRFLLHVQTMIWEAIDDELGNIEGYIDEERLRVAQAVRRGAR